MFGSEAANVLSPASFVPFRAVPHAVQSMLHDKDRIRLWFGAMYVLSHPASITPSVPLSGQKEHHATIGKVKG